eukprot:COSAG02_NODE_5891_length_3957_cov_2.013738_5_plen_467_part_00
MLGCVFASGSNWVGLAADGQTHQSVSTSVHIAGLVPKAPTNRFIFAPNQLAANVWYKANGSVINGHIEGSFSNASLWPHLHQTLAVGGPTGLAAFGTYAAEVSHVTDATLEDFRHADIPLSVEDPTWTQCRDGHELGALSFLGEPADLFCSIFTICPPGILGKGNVGWYQSSTGTPYSPAEIVFDERMPNLIPRPLNLPQLWNLSAGNWSDRKAAAFVDPCPAAAKFNPGVDRITGLIGDYLEFIDAATARYEKQDQPVPQFGLHWNVIAWWEWSDVECLDALERLHPPNSTASFQHAVQYLTRPCHRDTEHLTALVKALCAHGYCPTAVYHDVDYVYNTGYALDVLQRNKAALRELGVAFGLDIVDICGEAISCVVAVEGDNLVRHTGPSDETPNQLQEQTISTLTSFLIRKGIIDAETTVRVQSWTARPIEQGGEVSELLPGSFAHTANNVSAQLQDLPKIVRD